GSIDNEPFTNTKANYSVAGSAAYGKANSVVYMSPWEVYFLRAEAAHRYGTADNAEAMFAAAVTSNFDYLGAAGADDYLTSLAFGGASASNKMKLIATQKWISMNGTQEDEGWIESRRMNTPDNPVFHNTTDGLFKKPTLSVLAAGVHPSLWLYPQTEMSLNGSAPTQRSLTDKAFWDN
ncbi:MAG: SusD/RagB family nutrient-binding outer membrane lipoprotein, partial [Saprospiraceae bacterium]